MPTRTQTSKRPGGGRFARPAGKPTQRSGGGRRAGAARRATVVTRRKRQKSGVANAVGKVTSKLPGMGAAKPKRGATRRRGKKGPAGLAALAGAAGLVVKNRARLSSMIRGKGSSNTGRTGT